MKVISTLSLLLCVNQASAWWGTGHLLVARIAFDLLENEAPEKLQLAQALLDKYSKNSDEGKHSFVECATYADDIKGKGGAFQSGWHFIDTPYLDEGGKISDFDFKADTHNVTEAMTSIKMFLTNASGYEKTYEYQQIMSNLPNIKGTNADGVSDDEARSFSLRLLIHYVGDIHQPLHATSRVDKEYTKGDRGGNSFRLPYKESAGNLHAVFDSVMYEFTDYPKLPFNSADWTKLGSIASGLVKKYPTSKLANVKDIDFNDWSKESFEISESFVYGEINHHEKQALPADYIAKGKDITEQQLVTAGYRLRYLIDAMFSAEKKDTEMTFLN